MSPRNGLGSPPDVHYSIRSAGPLLELKQMIALSMTRVIMLYELEGMCWSGGMHGNTKGLNMDFALNTRLAHGSR